MRLNRHTLGCLGALAVTAMVVTGCTAGSLQQPDEEPGRVEPPSGLDDAGLAAWERWQQVGLDTYRYRLQVRCFCQTVSGIVVVTEGDVVAVDGDRYRGQTITGFEDSPPTVEAMFDVLADATRGADDVTATFDPVTGVPTRIDVDWMTNAIDDEISYRSTNLEPVVSR